MGRHEPGGGRSKSSPLLPRAGAAYKFSPVPMDFSSPPILRRLRGILGWVLALGMTAWAARAEVQFDVFPGYDNQVRSAGWFPVAFEVYHDGPAFDGFIELSANQFGGQPQRVAVELPTNTRKRIVVPMFSNSAGFLSIDARLVTAEGKMVAESLGLRVNQVAWEDFILGALPASAGALPVLPDLGRNRGEFQPVVARLQVNYLPDNPVALEGLNALYLGSAVAPGLKEPQVEALVAWVQLGGHLIVGVDQPTDVNATPWLRALLPAEVSGVDEVRMDGELHRWLVSGPDSGRYGFVPPDLPGRSYSGNPASDLGPDPTFDRATLPVAGLRRRDGTVLAASADGRPLVLTAARGRGRVTVMGFHPERDPIRSWSHRAWFWARVAGVPAGLLDRGDLSIWGGRGLDSVFGSMIETRQVQKLPVGVLLLLLLVYLVVIGPLDQWWLRKINRPMLTWVTFPAYVVLFSLLIYYLGFRLRAGNSEYNELHVVDVLPRGTGGAVLRGRTFTSLYSPANETYRMGSDLLHATLRPEFGGLWGGQGDSGKVTVRPKARGFEADVYVPVWMSQMTVGDWMDEVDAPLQARWEGDDLVVVNRTGSPFAAVNVVLDGALLDVGELAAGQSVRVSLAGRTGRPHREVAGEWHPVFESVANRRQELFGSSSQSHIDDWFGASVGASLLGTVVTGNENTRGFVAPAGIDLSALVARGDAVVFAWLPGEALVPPLGRFTPVRQQRSTLLRLVVPVPVPAS